jgi:hypothetical protein
MQELLCPNCKSGENFTTKENMVAYIECQAIYAQGPEPRSDGDSYYESISVSGVDCACGWSCHDSDWMDHLVQAP